MIKLTAKIIFLLTIITVTISCIKNNDAQDMIFDFYKQYLSSSINEPEKKELIKKYCTNNMLDMLDILYSFDEENGLIIGTDYDPFLNAQDSFPLETLRIEKKDSNKYNISWDKTDINVTLNVIKDNNIWKIDSIDIDNFEQIKNDVISYWKEKGKNNPKIFGK